MVSAHTGVRRGFPRSPHGLANIPVGVGAATPAVPSAGTPSPQSRGGHTHSQGKVAAVGTAVMGMGRDRAQGWGADFAGPGCLG